MPGSCFTPVIRSSVVGSSFLLSIPDPDKVEARGFIKQLVDNGN